MDKIESLRAVFSKASVIISDRMVSAVYTTKPGFIVQEIYGENLGFFIGFLSSCNAMRMRSSIGKGFSISFDSMISPDVTTFYPPLDGNITMEGIINSLAKGDDAELSGDFIEFAFKSKMKWDVGVEEFIDSVMQKTAKKKTESQQKTSVEKWDGLSNIINRLTKIIPLNELDFSEPDQYSDGFIEFTINGKMKNGILFNKESIDILCCALEASSVFSFEISVEFGEASVTFFP